MHKTVQPQAFTTSDVSLLAYAQHMVATARSDAARNLFASFVEQEKRWIRVNGGCRLPVPFDSDLKSDRRG